MYLNQDNTAGVNSLMKIPTLESTDTNFSFIEKENEYISRMFLII